MKRFASFAKQGVVCEPRPDQINLIAIFKDIEPLVRREFELEKIEFTKNIPKSIPGFNANRRDIEQILFNLIVNACQAMKENPGGRAHSKIEITAAQNNGHVNVLIKDTGPGISEDRLKRIFEPFYTTKGEGTGLGLYITKQLVEKNGGKISVKSKVGQGTTFNLEFKR